MEQNNFQGQQSKYSRMTELEKGNLKDGIFKSIRKYNTRKRRMRLFIGSAAVMVLMLGLANYYFLPVPQEQSIADFIQSSKRANPIVTDKIVLFLGEGDGVKIDEEITEVQYSNNGEKVTIGKVNSIEQQLNGNNKLTYNTLFVPFGKRSKLMLSDGSLVWLNSGSKLIYPAKFNGDAREVYIEGEAIFEVVHNEDKPFYVIAGNQKVRVLGTIFGVSNYMDENSMNTVLKSGSVEISYYKNELLKEPMEKVRITPGTMASYDKNSKVIVSEKVDVDSHFSWKEGFFVFKKDNLRYILKRISRYYNVKIEISQNTSMDGTFSGYLNLNENVETVLESIKESTNLNYEFTGNNEITIN